MTLDSFDKCVIRINYYLYILMLMDYLKNISRFDDLHHIIDIMEKDLEQATFPLVQLHISEFKIALLIEQNDEKALLKELLKYRNYFNLLQKQSNEILHYYMDMSSSLEYARKTNISLMKSSLTDELTGIYNRKCLSQKAPDMFIKAGSSSALFGVIMMDIDDFKQINDSNGHSTGDRSLKLVAEVLSAHDMPDYLCTRFGGDEFILIFSCISRDKVIETARSIRSDIRSLSVKRDLPEISVSLGLCIDTADCMTQLLSEYIETADKALYAGKAAGKAAITVMDLSGNIVESI
jgi:diguanylate cyclase (GGDEF)-like protein